MSLALVISTSIQKFEGKSFHRCIVELNNELDTKSVMLNLASFISASTWKPEESDCQFNVEVSSNLIIVRGVILNLTVVCQRCNINVTIVDLRYE